ncbi:MAG: MBL fold metallo-hydrolase [Desulfobacterales bacterium]|nr:MAG: MBL fold metallo-hydrolase [Desulfobacterales bacterium]
MSKWQYTRGLHKIGNGIYAYLQPDGSWGLNNAGLIVDGEHSMVVDTLYDLDLTQEMLEAMQAATNAAESIDILVNTHVNGDHCFGNQLFKGAEIIASNACAGEFATETPPQLMIDMLKAAPQMGELGTFFTKCFGKFNFEGITLTPPTKTFENRLDISVGEKEINLIEVGPCHTRGDIMVYIPGDRILFAGDVLFIEGTPIMWDGPLANWMRALDQIIGMDVETIVPGHGPVTDKNGVESMKAYWQWVDTEARKRYDAGMPAAEAAKEMLAGPYSAWGDPERIVINLDALYREFAGDSTPANRVELLGIMAKLV